MYLSELLRNLLTYTLGNFLFLLVALVILSMVEFPYHFLLLCSIIIILLYSKSLAFSLDPSLLNMRSGGRKKITIFVALVAITFLRICDHTILSSFWPFSVHYSLAFKLTTPCSYAIISKISVIHKSGLRSVPFTWSGHK